MMAKEPIQGKPWLIRRLRCDGAEYDLYCFPHAGGGPGEYARWADHLPNVQVWALQAPGRAARLAEPPITGMATLVDDLLAAVTFGSAGRPFAFFGHSLGALVAFATARALLDRGREQPARLFVSACSAPPLSFSGTPVHRLSDAALLSLIEQLWTPLPAGVHADPALLRRVLECYRADFTLLETYDGPPAEPLDVPFTAIAGADDPGHTQVTGWRKYTRNRFDFRLLAGGHFYFRDNLDGLLEILSADIIGHQIKPITNNG